MDFGYECYDIKMEKYLNSQYMDAEKKMGLQILRNENITNIFIRKFIGLGIVFLMLLIMNSCDGDDDPIEPDTPTVSEIVLADKSQSTLEFDAGASTQTVRFSTTQAWSAEVSSGDWCTVSPASGSAGNGSITVSVSENTEEAERSATVVLKAGEASLDLEVTQSLTSFDVEEVAGYITEVTETVDDLFMQSDGIAELSQNIEEIRSLDGVQDVSVTDDALYVEIKDGGIISWYYPPKSEPMDVNAVTDLLKKSFQTSMASTKGLASDHEYIEPQLFCIINQTANDENFASIASAFDAWKSMYDNAFPIELMRGEDANLELFASLTYFDFVFLETHGTYSNHQHWLATGETVTDETKEWLNSDAGRQWKDKSIGIMTLKEIRKSKAVKTAYWAISEKFIESMHDSFDNSIIFSTACKSLKESNTLASAFQNKGAGVYVGYDETNAVGVQAGINFWGYMSLGMTVEQAIENIPDEYKNDSEWGGVLHFYPQSNGNMCIVHPEVNTSDATNIGGTTATLQGEIAGWIETLEDNEAEAGFCWSMDYDPLVEDSQVISQSVSNYQKKGNTISLSGDIVELYPNTTYYYRAFLKMNDDYYYGDVKKFETGDNDAMREYLVRLYNTTGGDNWTRNDNWLSDKPITEWYGISDNTLLDGTYYIFLENNNLIGFIDLSGCPYVYSLDVVGNNLSRINVSGCSNLFSLSCEKNEKLFMLNISDTDIMGLRCEKEDYPSLTTIIAGSPDFGSLDCIGIPLENLQLLERTVHWDEGFLISLVDVPIKVLDLSGCRLTLSKLDLENVQLQNLNLSNFEVLEFLTIKSSTIDNVGISNCASLHGLWLDFSTIKNLSISDCAGIEDIFDDDRKVEVLHISNCIKLGLLDFTHSSLKELFISDCPNMETVYCYNNLLEELDMSGCPALVTLQCGDNSLKTINVSKCSNLVYLECDNNLLTDIDVLNCRNLEDLFCRNNKITKEIPVEFKRLKHFYYDVRYEYEENPWTHEIEYTDNNVGWWYPGEPESGKHAWPDE